MGLGVLSPTLHPILAWQGLVPWGWELPSQHGHHCSAGMVFPPCATPFPPWSYTKHAPAGEACKRS